jgi:hypothetical protein
MWRESGAGVPLNLTIEIGFVHCRIFPSPESSDRRIAWSDRRAIFISSAVMACVTVTMLAAPLRAALKISELAR